MAGQDSVDAVQAAADSLSAAARRVADEYGDTLGVRRLLSDVARIQENLDNLGDPQPGHQPRPQVPEYVVIDDKPYDESMWLDSETDSQHVV